jgi:hypothetical protein
MVATLGEDTPMNNRFTKVEVILLEMENKKNLRN